MIKKIKVSLLLAAFLTMFPAVVGAMTVYLKNAEEIDAETAWQANGAVFVKVNRDVLLDFSSQEVDLKRTFAGKTKGAKIAKADSGKKRKGAQKVAQNLPADQGLAGKEKKPSNAKGALKDENLLVGLPEGYKIGFQKRQGKMLMSEMVPQLQDVNSWTEMVTTQVFLGGVPQQSPEAFSSAMAASFTQNCQGAENKFIRNGTENGYPFAFWLSVCPRNPGTGKAETTLFKAIQGNDSFYLVQKAWKYLPERAEVATWSKFMSKVKVCDSRIKGSACLSAK